MIVRIRYEDLKGTNIKVVTDGKEVTGYLKVVITRENMSEAVSRLNLENRVVAFVYEGTDFAADMQMLGVAFPNKLGTPIIYTLDLSSMDTSQLTAEYLSGYCSLVPVSVRLVLKCPTNFSDMATVFNISKSYSNVRFCGGYFLRAPECNIGCICATDIKGRAFSSLSPVVQGCGCVMTNITFEDAEIIFAQGETRSVVTSEPKKSTSKPKRAATTLFELGGDSLSAF